MRDRVADVLAERAALDSGAAAGLILSILLHGSIVAAAVFAAFHHEVAGETPTLKIRFARAAAPAIAPPPPAPKPVAPRIEAPKPVQTTTAPPEKKTVPINPFGKSTKKGSENPESRPPATRQPDNPTTTPEPAVGETGVSALEGGDFPYTIYIDNMKRLIGQHWLRPQMGGAPKMIVRFTIERDGSIRDAAVELPSGNATFDRAALRAVLEASPLPPLPFGYNGTYLGVHLTFR